MTIQQKQKRKGTPRPTCKGNKLALGNRGGRPREWKDDTVAIEEAALRDWIKNPENYFLTNFLVQRGLCWEHLNRLSEYSEKFRETLERARLVQECRLVEMGVFRKGDSGFIKFILQNKAGWKDKSEVSGNAENPLAVIMEKIAQNARNPLDE